MPLTRLNDSAFDAQLEGVYFGMWNGSSPVRCLVTHEALTDIAGDLLHCGISKGPLSALGHDRSLVDVASMSGLPPKADIATDQGRDQEQHPVYDVPVHLCIRS